MLHNQSFRRKSENFEKKDLKKIDKKELILRGKFKN